MNTSNSASSVPHSVPDEPGEMDLVATWLIFDLPRTIAGAIAGVFASLVAASFAGFISKSEGYEFWFPFKIPAAAIIGRDALTYGIGSGLIVGTTFMCVIGAVLGMVYSHFFKTNRFDALLAGGFMWGTFSWIFINNLFSRSFLNVREIEHSNGVAFFVLLVFGFSLASLKVFDRIICGRVR